MNKYIPIILLFIIGCDEPCSQGAADICYCNDGNYMRYCCADGYFPKCRCPFPGYPLCGEDTLEPEPVYYGSGSDHEDQLLESYPQCVHTYINDCAEDEIKIPCTDLCWRICSADMDLIAGECTTYELPQYLTNQEAQDACALLNPDYRLPTVEEIAFVLNSCDIGMPDLQQTNFCGPYLTSPIIHVMDIVNIEQFDFWMGPREECLDPWEQPGDNCAWYGRMSGLYEDMPTKLDWLYAYDGPGTGLARAVCVREQ